jgi:hypothetical protein
MLEFRRISVAFFVRRFKNLLALNRVVLVDRTKNTLGLAALGLTKRNVFDELLDLDVDDFCRGPLPDDKGRPWDVWEFGRAINGTEVYIKLAIKESEGGTALIVSFHPAQFKLRYVFRGELFSS